MKKHNKIIKTLCRVLLACFMVFPLSLASVQAAQYDVVFKAGAHGTVNKQKSVTYSLLAGDKFPNEPTVEVNEGYIFTGWNKSLPPVGSPIEGKAVYVAQYDVVINGISYIVRYQDTQGVAIATAKTMMGESGGKIVERAKTIPGYTYQLAQQELTLSQTSKEIIFTYTLTNPEEVVRIVEERVDVVTPNVGTPTPDNGANIEDNQVPQGNGQNNEETITDQEVPQAKANNNSQSTVYIIGACVIAIIILGAVVVAKRKRKQD